MVLVLQAINHTILSIIRRGFLPHTTRISSIYLYGVIRSSYIYCISIQRINPKYPISNPIQSNPMQPPNKNHTTPTLPKHRSTQTSQRNPPQTLSTKPRDIHDMAHFFLRPFSPSSRRAYSYLLRTSKFIHFIMQKVGGKSSWWSFLSSIFRFIMWEAGFYPSCFGAARTNTASGK